MGKTLVIPTDYLDLETLYEPIQGNASISGYQIKYTPPQDFIGDDTMTLNGCNNGDCYRFDVTIHVIGEKIDPKTGKAESGGTSKLLFLLLLLLLLIPLICWPFYSFYRNKNRNEEDDESEFDHDPFYRDERGLLPNKGSSRRGMGDDSSGADWESSDDDDAAFEDASFDSRDKESDSDPDEDEDSRRKGASSVESSDDGFADTDGFSSESMSTGTDGFNDDF